MTYSLSLKQRVNFYVSVAFILAFGFFMTVTVINGIRNLGPNIKYLSADSELSQLNS